MRWIRFLLLGAILALVTVRFPARLTHLGLTPLWLFLPVLLYGLTARPGPAIVLAWLTGLAVDILSLEPLGLHAFLFAVAALLLVKVRGHLFASHPVTQAILGAVATLAISLALILRLNFAEPDLSVPPCLRMSNPLAMLSSAWTPCKHWALTSVAQPKPSPGTATPFHFDRPIILPTLPLRSPFSLNWRN